MTTLERADLDAVRFAPALCDTLFEQILIDDVIDAELRLPACIEFDHEQRDLIACFGLSRALWRGAFDRSQLLALTAQLARARRFTPAELTRFKHIRAKLKHFRYAHALYDVSHRYPRILNRFTVTMGQAQDAQRHGRRAATLTRAAQLRLLLTRPLLRRLLAAGDRLSPATPADFRLLLERDYAALAALLARPQVTGHEFHAARKVVGRQVSFWNALWTLAPSDERYRLSRWLSAINGAMGALHDELVERRASDAASYGATMVLPANIRGWIAALVERAAESAAR